jgi:hypothetical protein
LVAGLDTCAIELRAGGTAWLAVPLYSSTASWLARCGFDPTRSDERAECVAALATWRFSDAPIDAVDCPQAARAYVELRAVDVELMTQRCRTIGLDALARACWQQARSSLAAGAQLR